MVIGGYICLVTSTESSTCVAEKILEVTGEYKSLLKVSKGKLNFNVFYLSESSKNIQEKLLKLKSILEFEKVEAIPLSSQPTYASRLEIRTLFLQAGTDLSGLNNYDLDEFTASLMKQENRFLLELDRMTNVRGLFYVELKAEKDSRMPFKNSSTDLDNLRIDSGFEDEFETYVGISPEVIIDEFDPVPPPSYLPSKSDEEIIAWVKENDYRDLDDNDVEILRTADHLIISISFKDVTDTITCKIKD